VRLLRGGVDGEHHALLAVVGLQTEEPQGLGIRQRERPGRELRTASGGANVARRDTNNVGSHRGVRQLCARSSESRLCDGVVLRRKDEGNDVVGASGDVGRVEGERHILANHDGMGGLSDGTASSNKGGSESETHIDR